MPTTVLSPAVALMVAPADRVTEPIAVGVGEPNEPGPAMRMLPALPVPVVDDCNKPPVIVKSAPSIRMSPAVPRPEVVLESVVLVMVTEPGVVINRNPVLGAAGIGGRQLTHSGSAGAVVSGR